MPTFTGHSQEYEMEINEVGIEDISSYKINCAVQCYHLKMYQMEVKMELFQLCPKMISKKA